MGNIVEILIRCKDMLISAKAPKNDINLLNSLIQKLDNIDNTSYFALESHLQEPLPIKADPISKVKKSVYVDKNMFDASKNQLSKKSKNKPTQKNMPNIEFIARAYKKLKNEEVLTNEDARAISEIENKYPNIRSLMLGDLTNMYDRVSKIDEQIWSIEELNLLSFFHFDIKPSKSKNKTMLINILKSNIYNVNYMDSMKKQYEGNIE